MDGLTFAFLLAAMTAAVFAYLYFSLRSRIKDIRRDSIQKSQAVTIGKVTEHLVPFFPDFPFDPRDVRFLGTPIDLIVFDGLSNGGDIKRLVFVEVKTGKSGLSTRERCVGDAVLAQRIEWLEFRPALENV